jgi:hypothetical protein
VTVRPPRLAAGLALAVGLTACAGTAAPPSDDAAAAAQRIEVQVSGGRVSGDTGRVPVPDGARVTLVVTSDVADEVHVHGYDREAELVPGQPAEIAFDATIPGVFEVELHEAGTQLLSLQVG